MTTQWNNLAEAVEACPFQAGVSLMTLDGDIWGHRENEQCSAASVIKIPLMVEIMRQVDSGKRNLDDIHVLLREDKAVGSGVLLEMHDGLEVTLHDLLYLMISISDNTATNILIDFAGMEETNQRMQSFGFNGTVLNRKMQGRSALPGQKENLVVPAECSQLIKLILTGKAASKDSCDVMVNLLKTQQNRRRLARPLTDQHEHIEFGSKTGSIAGVCNDAGFFRVGDRTVVLSVFLEQVTDGNEAEAFIGAISTAALKDAGML
jgi:beta-lactamase class A